MSAAAAPWMPSSNGTPIDLLDPPAHVDFYELAKTLSHLNRYAGNSRMPVSVAQHTLIACDAAPEAFKPWVLLHDAHAARIGDILSPTVQALDHLIDDLTIESEKGKLSVALEELKRRHDRAIHAAAGLPWPTLLQQEAVRRADLVALQTERRDFLAPCEKPWPVDGDPMLWPASKTYRFLHRSQVADALYALFHLHLPAFAGA